MQKLKRATPKAESESLIEITFYRVKNFQHLLKEKATENNSSSNGSNNSNIVIRKELTFGTAALAVI